VVRAHPEEFIFAVLRGHSVHPLSPGLNLDKAGIIFWLGGSVHDALICPNTKSIILGLKHGQGTFLLKSASLPALRSTQTVR
jgi:hypothetical protein